MKTGINIFLIALSLLLGSCTHTAKESDAIDGIWTSIGSGRIMEIKQGAYTLYDKTIISCIPIRKASVEEWGTSVQAYNDTLSVTTGVLTYNYVKVNQLPELCTITLAESKKEDPIYNFEVFAQTLKEHYAFFELNKIRWDSLYTVQKSKLHANTSPAELYLVLEETLELLNDNHGYLEAPDVVYEEIERLSPVEPENEEEIKEYGDFEIANLVTEHYLEEDLTKDSWLISWGKMKENIGYIQLKAMWLYADLHLSDSLIKENGYVDTYVDAFHELNEAAYIKMEVHGVRKIMTQVMHDLKDSDKIIIDVRFNGGGQDAVSFEILRHFNDRRRIAATERLRFGNSFSPTQSIYVEGSESPYMRPVYVLTSRQTGSAAEAFAMATFSLEHIKRIGTHTSGALSTALEKKLPNGWDFALSNEVYMDKDGIFYENKGIPPHIRLVYSDDRQSFFRSIADNLEKDKQHVLNAIDQIEKQQ